MSELLQDQIGAMALIDDLRREEMQLKEHIDLPKRRALIAAKIREFYARNSFEVSDGTIEQGVKDYFKSRLAFEQKKLSLFQKVFTQLYVSRQKWGLKFLVAIAVLLGLGTAVHIRESMLQEKAIKATTELSSANRVMLQNLKHRLIEIASEKQSLNDSSVVKGIPVCRKLLEQLQEDNARAQRQLVGVTAGVEVSKDNYPAVDVAESASRKRLLNVGNALTSIEQGLHNIRAIAESKQQLDAMADNPSFQKVMKLELVKARFDETSALFSDVTLSMPEKLPVKVRELVDLVHTSSMIPSLNEKIEVLTKKFQDLHMSEADMVAVNTLRSSANMMVLEGNAKNLSNIVAEMENLFTFATTPLTINLVDREGVKTGVEREYSTSKGKSWFLIAETENHLGQTVPIWVRNSETGNLVKTSRFGVRVTQAQYLAAKEEKLNTGHIRNRKIGYKTDRALSLTFIGSIDQSPDMITEY